eukprot:CAMPEP_0175180662 /NCGR_PEP_ID=MMETSP0087-20121206/36198_1 /TAXON_ID=136419 /ORGANISM="Unknown Unknown, Strain D1" /LENGTH=72 /DNA_ID=CAMNT_0016473039 /DNA_START=16 /DNA_END=234 /DNA_ORIENTATION=-
MSTTAQPPLADAMLPLMSTDVRAGCDVNDWHRVTTALPLSPHLASDREEIQQLPAREAHRSENPLWRLCDPG